MLFVYCRIEASNCRKNGISGELYQPFLDVQSIENGRWGPYIKYGKLIVNLPKLDAGAKMTADQARSLELAEVKKIIEKEYPGVFDAKKAPAKGAKAGAKTAAKKK